jgi:hypothetical protein
MITLLNDRCRSLLAGDYPTPLHGLLGAVLEGEVAVPSAARRDIRHPVALGKKAGSGDPALLHPTHR